MTMESRTIRLLLPLKIGETIEDAVKCGVEELGNIDINTTKPAGSDRLSLRFELPDGWDKVGLADYYNLIDNNGVRRLRVHSENSSDSQWGPQTLILPPYVERIVSGSYHERAYSSFLERLGVFNQILQHSDLHTIRYEDYARRVLKSMYRDEKRPFFPAQHDKKVGSVQSINQNLTIELKLDFKSEFLGMTTDLYLWKNEQGDVAMVNPFLSMSEIRATGRLGKDYQQSLGQLKDLVPHIDALALHDRYGHRLGGERA